MKNGDRRRKGHATFGIIPGIKICQYGHMAATTPANLKATFTFDEATIRRLADAATRLSRPRSEIVRDAINDYHARLDRLSDEDRDRMLLAFDTLLPAVALRSREEVDRELREIRAARRGGGRRTPSHL